MSGYPPGYPGQPGYPQQPGYPGQPGQPQQPYPQQPYPQQGYPQQQPGYPPQGYPQQQPGYPPQVPQPGYGPGQAYAQPPGYAQNPYNPGTGGVMPGYGQQPAYHMPPGFVTDPAAGAGPYDPTAGNQPEMAAPTPGASATGLPRAKGVTDPLQDSSFGLGVVSVILSLLSASSCLLITAFPHWSLAVAAQAFLAVLAVILGAMQFKDANKIFGGVSIAIAVLAVIWSGVFGFYLFKNPPRPMLSEREAAAEEWLRDLGDAQDGFKEANQAYTKDFEALAGIDPDLRKLADGKQDGYTFEISEASANGFEAVAVPETWEDGTETNFFIDDDGKVRYNTRKGRKAGRADPVLSAE